MNQKIDGSALASCFKVAASCGKEINALSDALNNLITEYFSKDNEFSSDKPTNDCRLDDSEWVYSDIAYNFPLRLQLKSKLKGKRSNDIVGYLGYQISMIGDGIAAPENNEPLIHVFFWDEKVYFNEEDYSYMGYPIDRDQESRVRVRNNRLIEWNSEDSDKKTTPYWVFSLRLTSLSSSEDLKRCIVEPAFQLLHGLDVLAALPNSIEGIILYPDDESFIYETENSV